MTELGVLPGAGVNDGIENVSGCVSPNVASTNVRYWTIRARNGGSSGAGQPAVVVSAFTLAHKPADHGGCDCLD